MRKRLLNDISVNELMEFRNEGYTNSQIAEMLDVSNTTIYNMIGKMPDETIAAHRLSYETFVGHIPEGMEVCHKCDNPCCVNPEHLFVGTRQDNIDDREAKGRNHPPKGSNNGRAKLTESDVLSARFERLKNKTSYQKLAEKYGVSKRTMQNAINGKTWKCVAYMPEPPKEETHE